MEARIGNLRTRYGRMNPGRKHLLGPDITARQQRQYEHILASERQYHRDWTDKKRKQVAAATVRAMMRNPSMIDNLVRGLGLDGESRAERMVEEFHGRPPEGTFNIVEREHYDKNVAWLGFLVGLEIMTEDAQDEYAIEWPYDPEGSDDNIEMVCNAAGTNIEFIGGDQRFNWQKIEGASAEDKNLVYVGPVLAVSYFADKHHLEGPRNQKDGIEYRHVFGDEGGYLPTLVYDQRNCKLWLVGGDYKIYPEGIGG